MPVMKEWRCAAHGEFDSPEGTCPHGCSGRFVVREFRTAPAIRSGTTRNTDAITQQLANDYRLTDLSSRDGDSVMTNLRKKDWTRVKKGEIAPSSWVGGVPHASEGWTQRGEQAPTFNPATAGLQAGVALTAGKVPKPKAKIVTDSKGRPLAYRAALPEADL